MNAVSPGPILPVTLANLADVPRWVAWQTEDRGDPPKATKVPYNPHGKGKALADNPATWGTRDAAAARAASLPRPYKHGGIGFELGDLGDGRIVAGVDLDTCRDPGGSFTPWALAVIERFQTYAEISPSRTGCKLFFLLDPGDMAALLPLLNRRVVFRQGKGPHPPGIEFYKGGRYFAVTSDHLPDTPAELMPVALGTVEWLLREAGPSLEGLGAKKAGPASTAKGRSETALHKGAALVRAGASYEAMVAALRADPETSTWVTEKGDAADGRELRRIYDKGLQPPPTIGGHPLNEDGLALAFADGHKDRLRYDHDRGRWYRWDGVSWKQDTTRLAFAWSRATCRKLALEAGINGALLNTVAKVATAGAVEKFAQSDERLAVTSERWDAEPFLLGTPGGTVDLRTGKLRPAEPSDHITKLASVTPDETASCPLWLEFMDQVTGRDPGLVRFLQQWFGYSLTGDTREQALVFIYGPGGNGKGVLLGTMAGIMGDYAVTTNMETFAASKADRHPTEIAALAGARMVSASETEEGRVWAQARINQLTGGDTVSARFMRKDFFSFRPAFKLTMIGNYSPTLLNADAAARRRFNMIPFLFTPLRKDLHLEAKLRAEAPAILSWMIAGCLDWQNAGLLRPAVVTGATEEYFEEQDTVSQWATQCCTLSPYNARVSDTLGTLFKSWTAFAIANGEQPGSSKRFSQTLKHLGCKAVKHTPGQNGKRGFTGISTKLDATGHRWEAAE